MATQVIPCLSGLLLDPEKAVRDKAFNSFDVYINKLKSIAESMPDSKIAPPVDPTGSSISSTMLTPEEGSAGDGWRWLGNEHNIERKKKEK